MAGDNNITLKVVVSGAPIEITINRHEKVQVLMRKALNQPGVDLSGWSLRFAEGGPPISPDIPIAQAGISAGMTLFLDPNEGGGGNASAPAGDDDPPVLVDPAISQAKLRRQLEDWRQNETVYRQRGYELIGVEDLTVDVAFHVRLPLGPALDTVATPLAVRFDFCNYDIWAPSVVFVDPLTREPLAHPPSIRARDFQTAPLATGAPDLFVDGHPLTKRTFLCLRGVREYHNHFEHRGNLWLLYRGGGLGTLAQLCNTIWRLTTHSVVGLGLAVQRIQLGATAVSQTIVEIRQDNVDAISEQLRSQLGQVLPGVPVAAG